MSKLFARNTGNVDRIIRANTRQALTRQPCGGDTTEAPVFVLGMPRSY